jgi:hypothetical protein
MPRIESQGAKVRPAKKRMDMGTWLIILFGLVLLAGFGMMLIDVMLR